MGQGAGQFDNLAGDAALTEPFCGFDGDGTVGDVLAEVFHYVVGVCCLLFLDSTKKRYRNRSHKYFVTNG